MEHPQDEPERADPWRVQTTPARGRSLVDYTLNALMRNLVAFSAIADTKANIMITVCSIVLTVGITQFASPLLRWPLVLLAASTLTSLALAILAVLPSVGTPPRRDGRADPTHPGFNVLFFGHFAHLAPEEFAAELDRLSSDEKALLAAVARDLHGAGAALTCRKYRYLRLSYLVFVSGLLVTAVAAVLALFRPTG